ncbi:MAG: YlxM family DNA-binding protein [Bacilli bacterium]
MDKFDYMIVLYDYYGELFTDVQRKYFEDYYFNNYTLSEIATNYKVSRNAVYKNINATMEKLLFYEDKLKLWQKKRLLNDILVNIKDEEVIQKINQLY